MNSATPDMSLGRIGSDEGKGLAGCLFFLVLLGIAAFVGIIIGPSYYSYYGFETDVKAEASRAGAHFLDDETMVKDIMDMARRNEIRLARENITIERFAGQLFLTVRYSVPADFVLFQHTLNFEIKASSYIGRL